MTHPANPAVTIEKRGHGQAVAKVAGQEFEARFDATLRKWRVSTPAGEQFSTSAKLHSIGKLFDVQRALVEGAPVVELPPALCIDDPTVHRQVRRILDSMREFGFDQGGHWQSGGGATLESGWTPRVGGDPIFHTIGDVAGVDCTRADMIEAIAALADGRHPNLPPRMAGLPEAIKLVAEALAAERRIVRTETGSVRIEGPMLPANWDSVCDYDDREVL